MMATQQKMKLEQFQQHAQAVKDTIHNHIGPWIAVNGTAAVINWANVSTFVSIFAALAAGIYSCILIYAKLKELAGKKRK